MRFKLGRKAGANPATRWVLCTGIFLKPKRCRLERASGKKFDITLVGRHLTVVRNGVTVHADQELPGITGGGFLQQRRRTWSKSSYEGDHDGGMAYRNITISVPKR